MMACSASLPCCYHHAISIHISFHISLPHAPLYDLISLATQYIKYVRSVLISLPWLNLQVSITASCIPETNIREKPYQIDLSIDPTSRQIQDAHCTCKAGVTGNCKHSAGLIYYVNTERTTGCTDKKVCWKKPSQKLRELYPKGK